MVYRKRVRKVRLSRYLARRKRVRRTSRSRRSGRVLARAHKFARFANIVSGMNVASTSCSWDATNLVIKGPSSGTTLEYDGAMAFRFFDIKNESEFTNLFDCYMITGVLVQFQLITNPDSNNLLADTGPNSQRFNWFPKLWYTMDRDDNAPVTRSQIAEYPGCKCRVLRPNAITKVFIRYPRVRGMTTTSAGGVPSAQNGGIVSRPSYIDMAYDSTDHFGLKWAVDFMGLDVAATYLYWVKVDVKYYFLCKDVR